MSRDELDLSKAVKRCNVAEIQQISVTIQHPDILAAKAYDPKPTTLERSFRSPPTAQKAADVVAPFICINDTIQNLNTILESC